MDWTFGRIMLLPLRADDGVWSSKPREFMTAKGKFGFAPTDLAVGHDGSLYISVGGRGTRGAIFRITWKKTGNTDWWEEGTDYLADLSSGIGFDATTAEGLQRMQQQTTWCLQAPQPLCSWSRGRWAPVAERLGAARFRRAALDRRRPRAERVRAIEIVTELFGGFDVSTLKLLADDPDTSVRARTAWALGRQLKSAEELDQLIAFVNDGDPLVVRHALEAMIAAPPELDLGPALVTIARQLSAEQHFVRQTAARVVARLWPDQIVKLREVTRDAGAQTAIMRELGIAWHREQPSRGGIEIGLAILEADFPLELKQQSVRLLQVALGDVGPYEKRAPVFDGYAPQFKLGAIERDLDPYRVRVAKLYPSGDAGLDHELLRVIAMLQPYNVELLDKILNELNEDSHPTDDVHRLIAAARIPVERSSPQTETIARALVQIDHKIAARGLNQDSNWDDRMKELFNALLEHDPLLADAIVAQEGFGLPPHVMYLSRITAPDSLAKAMLGFERQIAADENYAWTSDVVFVLGESKEPRHEAMIREQFENHSVRSAVLSVLSQNPQPADRDWFVEGIDSALVEGVQASAEALSKLEPSGDPHELFALLSAAQRLSLNTKEFKARDTVMQVLTRALGNDYGFVFGEKGYAPQAEVLSKISMSLSDQYPEVAREQLGKVADQFSRVQQMAANLKSPGDPGRGRVLFERRSCARCHGGRKALGPDLAGAAKRFSTHDLLASIVNPDQNVSSRYRTTMIVTDEGKIHTGLIVYHSVDGLILRDAENKTWRFEASEIEMQRQLPNSLMPAGLLKDITSEELADLLAYLESL
jgi:putative heme-binding domain-containing protein